MLTFSNKTNISSISIHPDSLHYRVRSGQCLMCTFRASCCSARLSWAQVPTFAGSFVQDRKTIECGTPHLIYLFFYMHHPTDRITHTTAFVTPVMEHWLEREIAQWIQPMKDRSDDPSHNERTLLPRSYISLRVWTHQIAIVTARLLHCATTKS